jgi:hypothetical protein
MSHPDSGWNLHTDCPACLDKADHITQLEEALAAARASMILTRAELDALLVRYVTLAGRGRGEA